MMRRYKVYDCSNNTSYGSPHIWRYCHFKHPGDPHGRKNPQKGVTWPYSLQELQTSWIWQILWRWLWPCSYGTMEKLLQPNFYRTRMCKHGLRLWINGKYDRRIFSDGHVDQEPTVINDNYNIALHGDDDGDEDDSCSILTELLNGKCIPIMMRIVISMRVNPQEWSWLIIITIIYIHVLGVSHYQWGLGNSTLGFIYMGLCE